VEEMQAPWGRKEEGKEGEKRDERFGMCYEEIYAALPQQTRACGLPAPASHVVCVSSHPCFDSGGTT